MSVEPAKQGMDIIIVRVPRCATCGARLYVASSRRAGECQIRYWRCRACGTTDKTISPAAPRDRVTDR